MKRTIHYISSFKHYSEIKSDKYRSKLEVVQAHVRYAKRKAVEMLGNEKDIYDMVKILDQKVNSRVALSFTVAIPNDIERADYKRWLQEIREFFSKQFNMDEKLFFLALHEEHDLQEILGTENKHVHIVCSQITKENKKLRLNPKDLSRIHKEWQEFLKQKGYEIYKDTSENKTPKLGLQLRTNRKLLEEYKQKLQLEREMREIEEKANKTEKLDIALSIRGTFDEKDLENVMELSRKLDELLKAYEEKGSVKVQNERGHVNYNLEENTEDGDEINFDTSPRL
ncbi:MAG: MobA/MobL family protein [Candidatus Kryptonium sp.]